MRKGQSLFEVVIALAISALIIVTLVALVSGAIRNSTFSKNKTLAARFAQEATEWLRGERDKDIEDFLDKTATTKWCLQDLSFSVVGACSTNLMISGTPFRREVEFSDCETCTNTVVQADIVVYWSDSQGDHEVRSATNFTDWRER